MTSEADDEKALQDWHTTTLLFADLIAWVLARAPRCMASGCRDFAYHRSPPHGDYLHREALLCDSHNQTPSVAIPGADVIRRVLAFTRR